MGEAEASYAAFFDVLLLIITSAKKLVMTMIPNAPTAVGMRMAYSRAGKIEWM